jgi:hypothetical protein
LYLGADGTRTLGQNEVVVMGMGSPGFNDSGLFGIMSAASMQGIVVLPDDDKKEYENNVVWEEVDKEDLIPATFAAPQLGNPTLPEKPETKKKGQATTPKRGR